MPKLTKLGLHLMSMGRCVGHAGKAGQPSQGELLFSVLLEFWLTDGEDPSLKDPKDSRLAPPLPYEAPTPDLLAALQVRPVRHASPFCVPQVEIATLGMLSIRRCHRIPGFVMLWT